MQGLTAVEIAHIVACHRYSFNNETELQEQIASVLVAVGVEHLREVRINEKDRLDFLCGSIAIEVKIAGSRPQVITQIHRYAQSDLVSAIILVTRKACHLNMPASINGKGLYVASLLGGSF